MLKWKREGGFPHMAGPVKKKKEKGKEVDLHMVTVEMLCISISNGPRGSGAGPDRESRDCIQCVV